MKLKCTRITQVMTWYYPKNENGKPKVTQIPRWDITFEIVGEHRLLSGALQINTTYPEQAARYTLDAVYEFSDLEAE